MSLPATITPFPEHIDAVPIRSSPSVGDPQSWGPLLDVPCNVTLDLPIPAFTIANLLNLEPGAILETNWGSGEDVPLRINGQFIAWAEFEVLGTFLAARITEWG